LLVVGCFFAGTAQVTSGTVPVLLPDPNGAVVPNAKVTLSQEIH